MNRVSSVLCSMRLKQNFIKLQFSFCGFCGCQESFASNKLLRVKFPQEEDNMSFAVSFTVEIGLQSFYLISPQPCQHSFFSFTLFIHLERSAY